MRKREVYYSENYLRFREKSAIILLFIYGVGIYVLFALEIMEGGLDYGKWKCDNYYRLGSARQEHSAVFSACQVSFHTIYNEPVAGDRVHYALASAFCVCRKDGGLILKS